MDDSLLIGDSLAMRHVRARCLTLARRRRTIVIVGETGTGKSLVAEELHRRSGNPRPLMRISASELPAAMIQSVLAGHLVGAFTSALKARLGLLAAASGGIVFGDDFQDLELAAQPYLLDVMEGKPIRAMGSERTFIPDVRWIIGLQRSPEELIAEGRLRPDLAARWGFARIIVPPLRERREDVAQLAPHLLARMAAAEEDAPTLEIAPEVMGLLMRHSWPRNVRQLDSVLYAAMSEALAEEAETIHLHHLPEDLRSPVRGGAECRWLDRAAIAAALAASHGVAAHAAARLGVHPRTLSRHMREMGLRGANGSSAEATGT
jgi:DNA-binding NtrC family response regulator